MSTSKTTDLHIRYVAVLGAIMQKQWASEEDIVELAAVAGAALSLIPETGPNGFTVRCDTEQKRDYLLDRIGAQV